MNSKNLQVSQPKPTRSVDVNVVQIKTMEEGQFKGKKIISLNPASQKKSFFAKIFNPFNIFGRAKPNAKTLKSYQDSAALLVAQDLAGENGDVSSLADFIKSKSATLIRKSQSGEDIELDKETFLKELEIPSKPEDIQTKKEFQAIHTLAKSGSKEAQNLMAKCAEKKITADNFKGLSLGDEIIHLTQAYTQMSLRNPSTDHIQETIQHFKNRANEGDQAAIGFLAAIYTVGIPGIPANPELKENYTLLAKSSNIEEKTLQKAAQSVHDTIEKCNKEMIASLALDLVHLAATDPGQANLKVVSLKEAAAKHNFVAAAVLCALEGKQVTGLASNFFKGINNIYKQEIAKRLLIDTSSILQGQDLTKAQKAYINGEVSNTIRDLIKTSFLEPSKLEQKLDALRHKTADSNLAVHNLAALCLSVIYEEGVPGVVEPDPEKAESWKESAKGIDPKHTDNLKIDTKKIQQDALLHQGLDFLNSLQVAVSAGSKDLAQLRFDNMVKLARINNLPFAAAIVAYVYEKGVNGLIEKDPDQANNFRQLFQELGGRRGFSTIITKTSAAKMTSKDVNDGVRFIANLAKSSPADAKKIIEGMKSRASDVPSYYPVLAALSHHGVPGVLEKDQQSAQSFLKISKDVMDDPDSLDIENNTISELLKPEPNLIALALAALDDNPIFPELSEAKRVGDMIIKAEDQNPGPLAARLRYLKDNSENINDFQKMVLAWALTTGLNGTIAPDVKQVVKLARELDQDFRDSLIEQALLVGSEAGVKIAEALTPPAPLKHVEAPHAIQYSILVKTAENPSQRATVQKMISEYDRVPRGAENEIEVVSTRALIYKHGIPGVVEPDARKLQNIESRLASLNLHPKTVLAARTQDYLDNKARVLEKALGILKKIGQAKSDSDIRRIMQRLMDQNDDAALIAIAVAAANDCLGSPIVGEPQDLVLEMAASLKSVLWLDVREDREFFVKTDEALKPLQKSRLVDQAFAPERKKEVEKPQDLSRIADQTFVPEGKQEIEESQDLSTRAVSTSTTTTAPKNEWQTIVDHLVNRTAPEGANFDSLRIALPLLRALASDNVPAEAIGAFADMVNKIKLTKEEISPTSLFGPEKSRMKSRMDAIATLAGSNILKTFFSNETNTIEDKDAYQIFFGLNNIYKALAEQRSDLADTWLRQMHAGLKSFQSTFGKSLDDTDPNGNNLRVAMNINFGNAKGARLKSL